LFKIYLSQSPGFFQVGPDGCVEPLDRPGIGLDIDEKIFADFPAIDGPGYVVTF